MPSGTIKALGRGLVQAPQGQGLQDRWSGRYTTMTLDVGEFIRRFLIHVLVCTGNLIRVDDVLKSLKLVK
jgi:hypothetical protein